MRLAAIGLAAVLMSASAASAETLRLYAAGSLKAALSDVAVAYQKAHSGVTVETVFGASGLLRERLEKGEEAHVFASANMKHPETLVAAGKAAPPVRMFARNTLCALVQPEIEVATETLLDRMLDDDVRVGTSTPKADPSGDYAFALFARSEDLRPGARAALEAKALQLTGGPGSEKAPDGRNLYGWVMSEKKADIFLTYCTNAILARKDTPDLKVVQIPEKLSVGADYGLVTLSDAPASAAGLAEFILGAEAQAILRSYGFESGADAAN